MDYNKWCQSEPMKYWTPAKDKHIELDILDHPEKYQGYLASKKMDGEWTRVIKDNGFLVQSRSISKVTGTYGDKTELVPHILDGLMLVPDGTVILGELCFLDLSKHSKDVGTITRCKPEKAIERQKKTPLYFYIFDIVMFNGEDISDKPYSIRMSEYINKVKSFISSEFIHFAEPKEVVEIVNEYDDYLQCGGEGYVLVLKDAKYTPGTRTAWSSIKLKKATDELVLPVVDTIEPEQYYNGKEIDNWQFYIDGKAVTKAYYNKWKNGVVVDNNGTLVKITSGASDKDKEWLATSEASSLILNGKIKAIVQAMEIEKTGSLRHPCLKELVVE